MFVIAAALLGAIFGSFINALSFRFGTGRSVLRGRSQCMHCGHTLGAIDLVPVCSYLFLRGKCRYCGSAISAQYPLVECAAAALAAGVWVLTPLPLPFIFWLFVWMLLLFIVVYDMRHHVIPWSCSILLVLLALGSLALTGAGPWAFASGPILALPFFFLSLVSGGRWMGWGDGPLELGLGWLLGLSAGFFAFLIAFWTGAAVGIALMWVRRGYTMKSELPFAPFLILGAGVAYFFHVTLFTFASLPF